MYSLVNSNFNRTYNPSGRQNALSDIKRLLTSRDTTAQNKACGYLIEVASRYNRNSEESGRLVEYLLDNDITVFLCEATANLDFSLFRSIATCLRLLWRSPRFYSEEHAAHATSAVLRALAHYTASGPPAAVDTCLHFLCDLLTGISAYKTTPPLSHQSAYSAVQLLACLNSLAPQIGINPSTILSSALVLEALVSYQPDDLYINGSTTKALVPVLSTWVSLTLGALQHAALVDGGVRGTAGMALYVVLCTLGLHAMGLMKLFQHGNKKANFVQTILVDDEEVNVMRQCSAELAGSVQQVMSELVVFTKEHQSQIGSEEYGVFLKFLLTFLYESGKEVLPQFCDALCSGGYLTMLPQVQIARNDASIRKASTLVLGELLKVLADNYLIVHDADAEGTCANDIHMGLVELQYGIERPQSLGLQLQKGQPYSLLVYIYFYCQSTDNPEEATAPLLPFLVEHILKLPTTFRPPPYIIKALWLVFAMSTISNDSLESLEERVYLEKATERLVGMLQPQPCLFYTHNPAILLWAFTSQRIPSYVKFHVISQWLKVETCLPLELTTDPTVWELLLNVVLQSDDRTVVEHCMESLQLCMEDGADDIKEEFTTLVWFTLPNVLSKALIGDGQLAPNTCYLLELATTLLPSELDPTLCLKTAVLITVVFSKNIAEAEDNQNKCHFEYVCLKLCLYLLGLASSQNDNRVLITYVNRTGFLPSVLSCSNSQDETVACAALQLLSYVVHYFTKNNYQPKSVLEIQTQLIIRSFRRDSNSERGASLLQLVYLVLNSGANTPLGLAYDVGDTPLPDRQCSALRCLMFRIQLMLCSRESKEQSSAGWKTLSSIFKHAIMTKNDTTLVATLTSQPWTFTLVQFQISQPPTEEFLTFLHNWLTLLKITVKKNQQESRSQLSKYSLVTRTMVALRRSLKEEDDHKELIQKSVTIVKEILDSAVTIRMKY